MIRRVRLAMALVPLVFAGVYVFVYLYRWEWHRTLVAASLFVAAEVALVGGLLAERLRRIEARLDALANREGLEAQVRAHLDDAAPEPRTSFPWMAPDPERLSVFVPLLLGAGVVLSGAAWVVERVARATAGAALVPRLARAFTPLVVPAGVLTAPYRPAPVPRRRPVVAVAAAAALLVVTVPVGLRQLAAGSQNRADVAMPDATTAVHLDVADLRRSASPLDTARTLWGTCAGQLSVGHQLVGVRTAGTGQVVLEIRPGVGTYAERRLRGCLEDAAADRVQARVLSFSTSR